MADTGKIQLKILPAPLGENEEGTLVAGPVVTKIVTLVQTRDDGVSWRDEWGIGFTPWSRIESLKPWTG